jgi:hypothetical protein
MSFTLSHPFLRSIERPAAAASTRFVGAPDSPVLPRIKSISMRAPEPTENKAPVRPRIKKSLLWLAFVFH